MASSNHKYIDDGIAYNVHIFNEDGIHHRMSYLWEVRVAQRSPKTFDHIMSHDGSQYVVNNVTNVRVCGDKQMVTVYTRSGRRFRTSLGASLITEGGIPVEVRNLQIGMRLLTVDNYKYYFGDKVALRTDGNSRVRALLRNHGVPFEVGEFGGTETELGNIYCVDYKMGDTFHTGVVNHTTFDITNWRDGVKQMFGLPETSLDEIVSIVPAKSKYVIAVWVDGPQNIVTENGILVQSTQTEVRDDKRYR
jgi:hypothetical protein